MRTRRSIIILLAIAAVTIPMFTCLGGEKRPKGKEKIWKDEGPGGPGMESGPGGPGMGHGPRGRRFELTDEEIERILQAVKEKDPEKAKELQNLRKTDPEQFQRELRESCRDEVGKIFRERFERWIQQRQAEFLEWLDKNYPQEAQELASIKDKDPELYNKKLELVREKYWRIFEEERRNPELAGVLKEDLELKESRDELIKKIKSAKDDDEKKILTAQLEEVISRRFDLIIRRKQIAYEELLRRIEWLQKQVTESKEEIKKWKDAKFKEENVKKHVEDLIGGRTRFRWD